MKAVSNKRFSIQNPIQESIIRSNIFLKISLTNSIYKNPIIILSLTLYPCYPMTLFTLVIRWLNYLCIPITDCPFIMYPYIPYIQSICMIVILSICRKGRSKKQTTTVISESLMFTDVTKLGSFSSAQQYLSEHQ